ncbi:MAG: acyl-CoA dehydrogenase family protein [Xenococcaceae cyanobacterium MO_188.B29]|nr:acyl-CoA dehydrogenase family protein [Xenococcaceae cyanobacterium MO_188.B29]
MVTDLQQSKDFLAIATTLSQEFAKTAVERDARGGTPTEELDRLRDSGLLSIVIPKEYGGYGETWFNALKVVREISKVDGSLGQLLGYHYANSTVPKLFGTPEQNARFSARSASHKWFWGDAVNPRDPDLILTPDGDNFRLNGVKKFCTGAKGSDVIVISGIRSDLKNILFAVLPSDRDGMVINDDWDFMGQRQTDSGSVIFNNVLVQKDEVLGDPNSQELPSPFATMVTCLSQLIFVNLYLGIALGAFESAKEYTQTTTRPWLFSPVDRATEDPYIIEQYGNLWVDLMATESHTNHVASLFQKAWDKGKQLTAAERGEVAVAIASAKVLSTKVGLNVTSKIFEVMGARAGASKYGFDRYWRNMRTHTLHDPIVYKVHEVGNWVLNKQIPSFTLYT